MKTTIKRQSIIWVLLLLFHVFLVPIHAWGAPDTASDGIQIEMRSTVPEISAGDKFAYEINYSVSSTTQQFTNAVIALPLPKELIFDSAVDAGDTSHTYTPGNHTVSFLFKGPVKAGTTGTLQVVAHFGNYVTPNKTTVEAQSRFESMQGNKSSNNVKVSAKAAAKWALTKERSSPIKDILPKPGSEVEYKLTLYDNNPSVSGKLELNDVAVRDVLPANAEYISARPGPALVQGNVVTWHLGKLGQGVAFKEMWVKVRYPEGAAGQVTNTAEAKFTPLNESEVTLRANAAHSFTPISGDGGSGFLKRVHERQKEVSPGQQAGFVIGSLGNSANVPMQQYELIDMTPEQLELEQVFTPVFAGIQSYKVQYTVSDSVYGPWLNWRTVRADRRELLTAKDAPVSGIKVKGVKFVFDEVPVDFSQTGNLDIVYKVNPDYAAPGTPDDSHKITNTAVLKYVFEGSAKEERRSASVYVVQNRPLVQVVKSPEGASNFLPGDKVKYKITVRNSEFTSAFFRNPVVEDILPPELEYVDGSARLINDDGMNLAAPKIAATPDAASGRTRLAWSWSDANPAVVGMNKKIELQFEARIKSGVKTGPVDNRVEVFSDKHVYLNSYDFAKKELRDGKWYVYDNAHIYVNNTAKLESVKWVQGDLDGVNWTQYPDKGATTPGGKVEYKLQVTNTGNIPVKSLLIVDAFPRAGDRGVVDTSPRDSKWSPVLTGKVTAGPDIKVYYTTDATIAMTGGHWSLEPPADLTAVTGLKFEFPDGHVMAPGARQELSWVMRAPVNAPVGQAAWSSFGYTAKRADNGKSLLATEPLKVGMVVREDANGQIGNYVWNDLNEDGIQNEPPDQGKNGVRVELYNADRGALVQSTMTGNDFAGNPGYYSFTDLKAGSYRVKFIAPAGYGGWAAANQGGDAVDSDADADGWSGTIRLDVGERIDTVDAGLIPPKSKLGDKVWADLNGDGLQDAGENGLDGVAVSLFDRNGFQLASTVTSNGGKYEFNRLTAGDYVVQFRLPSGYSFTKKGDGSNPELDSDADADGKTAPIRLNANESITSVDAGLVSPNASIGNRVWIDDNGNGVQDAGEPGLNGVAIQLLDESGAAIASTSTVRHAVYGDGHYQFDKLWPARYSVQFVLPGGGYEFTVQGSDPQSDTDSNADPSNGRTAVIPLGAGESNQTVDAGVRKRSEPPQRGTIGDYVWVDLNGDGMQNDGASGLNDVVVKLYDDAGSLQASTVTASVYDAVYGTVRSAVYSASGYYRFEHLLPGRYAVKFEPPPGYTFAPKEAGGDRAADSNANPDGMTDRFALEAGQSNLTVDAGLRRVSEPPATGSIGDYVWNDTNRDGVQNHGEAGMNGVTVKLYADDGQLLNTAVTGDVYGNAGYYRFDNVQPGNYRVKFEAPSGYEMTVKEAGDNRAADSNANPDGMTDVIALARGQVNLTVDAGVRKRSGEPPATAKLGDYVWVDTNRDGIQSEGEPGLNGVFVHLFNDAGQQLASTVTATVYGKAGGYSFGQLQPGRYVVKVDLPSDYEFTGKGAGADRTVDSDVNGNGVTDIISLAADETNLTIDAGLVREDDGGPGPGRPEAAIGDRVWIDANKDGLQNNGESGANGVVVKLYNEAGTMLASTVTASTYAGAGYYSFSQLQAGNYVVKFELPSGYAFTQKGSGSDRAADSDVDGSGASDPVTVASAERNMTIDAGIYLSGSNPGPSDPGGSDDPGGGSPGTSQPGGGGGVSPSNPPDGQTTPSGNVPETNGGGDPHGGGKPGETKPNDGKPGGDKPAGQSPSESGGESAPEQPTDPPSDAKGADRGKSGTLPLTGESMPPGPWVGLLLIVVAIWIAARGKKARRY